MNSSDRNRLAEQFMNNALKVQKGENVWIEYVGAEARKLADACASIVRNRGASPYLVDSSADVINKIGSSTPEEIAKLGKEKLNEIKSMQAYIRITDDAESEKVRVNDRQMQLYNKAMQEMLDYRVNNARWLIIDAPTKEFAAACGMNRPEFERFYLEACLADYNAMAKAVEPLRKLMADGKTVRIVSPEQDTDLTFSIEGIPAVPCVGVRNIPDGECYTAPVKDSVNGTITFGPSCYEGQKFQFIKLRFRDGRIEHAEAENAERTKKLNEILNTDPGARYTGEFSINFNPIIKHPTGSILFDEKIDGGIHMAMGDCYERAPNGNKSIIHWDMVHIQRPDYGGGELYIDGRLIRKDGRFVVPELEPLNPENLISAGEKLSAASARR